MKQAIHTIAASVLVTVAAIFGTTATAGPIDPDISSSVTITFNTPIFTKDWYANVTLSGTDHQGRVSAGRFSGKASILNNVTEETFVNGVDEVLMYCFDLLQHISPGDKPNYAILFSPTKFSRTLDFIGAINFVLNEERDPSGETFDPYAWVRPNSRAQSVAIQLGLWETKYDSSWDMSNGSFSVVSVPDFALPVLNSFKARYQNSDNKVVKGVAPELVMILEDDTYQDMIAADPPTQVSAPGTAAILLFGLALLRRVRRYAN